MKYQNMFITELTRDEVLALTPTTQVLVYNPYANLYDLEFADKNCQARNKFALSALRYFLFSIGELPGNDRR